MSTTTLTPSPARTQSVVRRHPLIIFYVLTYAISWMIWAPLVIFRDSIPGPVAFILILRGIPRTVHARPGVHRPPQGKSRRT